MSHGTAQVQWHPTLVQCWKLKLPPSRITRKATYISFSLVTKAGSLLLIMHMHRDTLVALWMCASVYPSVCLSVSLSSIFFLIVAAVLKNYRCIAMLKTRWILRFCIDGKSIKALARYTQSVCLGSYSDKISVDFFENYSVLKRLAIQLFSVSRSR